MIHKKLIFLDLEAGDKQEVISRLADELLAAGKVRGTYKQAVLAREETYPTGLPLEEYNIAMPHTFAEHVIEPVIAVARLKEPVDFLEMGTKDVHLPVSLVLMMAISNPQEQVGLLRRILRLFADEDVLREVMTSETVDGMYEALAGLNG